MNADEHLLGELVRWWAGGWKRAMKVSLPITPEEHLRSLQRSLKIIRRAIAANHRLLATAGQLSQSQQPEQPERDETDPEARLTIEHGTICIRNFNGWLLWSSELERLSRGTNLKDVLEQVAANHASWLEARQSATRKP